MDQKTVRKLVSVINLALAATQTGINALTVAQAAASALDAANEGRRQVTDKEWNNIVALADAADADLARAVRERSTS